VPSGGSSGSGPSTSGSGTSGSPGSTGSDSGYFDAGAPPDGGSQLLVWPNAASYANSDPWLVQHHTEIREIHPRILVIDFANGTTKADVTKAFEAHKALLMEGSRHHGYSDPSAKPFLIWDLAKLVDLTDATPPPGWTAPNSTKMPRDGKGGIDFSPLFNQTFADYYGIADPKNPLHKMTLCELLAAGAVNEVRIAFNKTGSDANVPSILENKQIYTELDLAIPGAFSPFGSWGTAEAAAVACGRSLRIGFIEMTGLLGNAIFIDGDAIQGPTAYALPRFKAMVTPFLNFGMDARYGVPFSDWYAECPLTTNNNCIDYPDPNSASWHTSSGARGTIRPFNQGCGSIDFPPNARHHYDQLNTRTVLSTCEHYGLHDGPGGMDMQTPFDVTTLARWTNQYGAGPTSPAWYLYWFQSLPGLDTKATMPDGTPMRNWWVYLYY
jgi:hypothetical protein